MKQFTSIVTTDKRKKGTSAYVRVTIPAKLVEMFKLEPGDIVLVEPDATLGYIRLIPAKIVPRNGLAKLQEQVAH